MQVAEHHLGLTNEQVFFILFGLLSSCNQLMGLGVLEAGMNLPLKTSTSVRHESGGFILSYFPSLCCSPCFVS